MTLRYDTFPVIGDRPLFTIMKSNLQLHKMMTDVLWVYPDNCLPETYPRVGGIHLFMGVIGVQL